MPNTDRPTPFSERALLRYHVVSLVRAGLLAGEERRAAVHRVAALWHATASGERRRVSVRSIYRWLGLWETGGLEALEDRPRPRTSASRVLPPRLLSFLESERAADRAASVPEMLKRAEYKGVIRCAAALDRTTVYRALVRRGVDMRRTKQERGRDMRRFSYAHRMEMVLADGKQFRVGERRLRRVAVFFLDDATRLGLDVVVGSSESAALFLRGLYAVLCRNGLMGILYLDNGPGFIANAVAEVCRRLERALIHGTSGYAEGHGKVERFNRTAKAAVLRSLDRRPDVDPAHSALELRLRHWLFRIYNHTPHEGLARVGGRHPTPHERWHADVRELPLVGEERIRQAFVLYRSASVSADRIVSLDGTLYELPRRFARGGRTARRAQIQEHLLDGTFRVVCPSGELVRIHPVDLVANARARRARPDAVPEEARPSASAADLAFQDDLGSVLDADGGVAEAHDAPQPHERNDG